MSMGHGYSHFSTFVTKLNFFGQMDGQIILNLNALKWGHEIYQYLKKNSLYHRILQQFLHAYFLDVSFIIKLLILDGMYRQ